MNEKTFNTWIRELGYTWIDQEHMMKGFMTRSEAQELINQFVSEGSLKRA